VLVPSVILFLDWERDYILKTAPTPELLQQHREEFARLIRTVKLLHATASDPEFPDPSVKTDFAALLDRLSRSWQPIQESGISPEHSDMILRECFPNGSTA